MSQIWDTVIIGGGPAGLSAAIYIAREQHKVLIIESKMTGGMMALTSKVDNYPGFMPGTSGFEISQQMTEQVKSLGAEIEYSEVIDLVDQGSTKLVKLANDKTIEAKTVLIATGTEYRHLNVPGEDEMLGRGVHFCATCDGPFYKDKTIAVIGGGNSAIEEAKFLTKFASKIYLMVRGEITASSGLVKELEQFVSSGQVEIVKPASVTKINHNHKKVVSIDYQSEEETKQLEVEGVFVFIGLLPKLDFVSNLNLKLDKAGFIEVSQDDQTNQVGIYACGDITAGAIRQIATAAGDGVKAALAINKYLENVIK